MQPNPQEKPTYTPAQIAQMKLDARMRQLNPVASSLASRPARKRAARMRQLSQRHNNPRCTAIEAIGIRRFKKQRRLNQLAQQLIAIGKMVMQARAMSEVAA
jgi:hypothetical protein